VARRMSRAKQNQSYALHLTESVNFIIAFVQDRFQKLTIRTVSLRQLFDIEFFGERKLVPHLFVSLSSAGAIKSAFSVPNGRCILKDQIGWDSIVLKLVSKFDTQNVDARKEPSFVFTNTKADIDSFAALL
jgi:hypothetical protein